MTQLHRHDLARPDATIRYWTGGPDDAATVVLLHGATLDHRAWHPQTDALRPRFHVIAPDLRGHGSSTGRFDFTAAVQDVLALLDHLPGPPVVLVGLSLGANIAQEVIRRRPDLVRGLVAADTTCNTADRHPLAATTTIAALRVQALWAGNEFARQAARPPPTHRSRSTASRSTPTGPTKKPSTSSPACSRTHCNPTRATGCPCPHCSCTDSSTTSATSPPTCGDGPTGSHWPDMP